MTTIAYANSLHRPADPRLMKILSETIAIYNQATALGLLLVIVPLLTFYAATKV